MNYEMIGYLLGIIMNVEAGLLTLPLIVSFIYRDGCAVPFLIPIVLLLAIGITLTRRKPDDTAIFAREGFVVVSSAWIVLSLFGALPFRISGEIPSYVNAVFETVSGFTTTGASILTNVEAMSKSLLFWRSFTHWIGGMGVLVFVMAIIPLRGGQTMYLMRAETPGPTAGKLVPKMRVTAMILYGIYIVITVLETILLLAGGMPFYDALLTTFGSVGTGGFGVSSASIGYYDSAYIDAVVTIFMTLCGLNFNLFYLILTGHVLQALRSEELRWYLGVFFGATIMITLNILPLYDGILQAFRYAIFQTSSIMTTTGFATADFNLWPSLSRTVLVLLMLLGGSAGSTAGGLKIARLMILAKSIFRDVKKALHPREYRVLHYEGKPMDEATVSGVSAYFALYMLLMGLSILMVSANELDLTTTVTAVIACFNNIGPGLELVGPMGSYDCFNDFTTVVLTLDMLFGRLEIIPMLMLFSPSVWRRGKRKRI